MCKDVFAVAGMALWNKLDEALMSMLPEFLLFFFGLAH